MTARAVFLNTHLVPTRTVFTLLACFGHFHWKLGPRTWALAVIHHLQFQGKTVQQTSLPGCGSDQSCKTPLGGGPRNHIFNDSKMTFQGPRKVTRNDLKHGFSLGNSQILSHFPWGSEDGSTWRGVDVKLSCGCWFFRLFWSVLRQEGCRPLLSISDSFAALLLLAFASGRRRGPSHPCPTRCPIHS